MRSNSLSKLFIVLLLALSIGVPAFAQEATMEPGIGSPTVLDITAEPPPLVVGDGGTFVVEDGGTLNVNEQPESAPSFDISSVYGLVAAILVVMAGGGTFAFVFARLTNNKQALDNTEKLYEGLSPSWQGTINRVIDTAEYVATIANQALVFANKVTDGKPNVVEPDPPLSGSAPHR